MKYLITLLTTILKYFRIEKIKKYPQRIYNPDKIPISGYRSRVKQKNGNIRATFKYSTKYI